MSKALTLRESSIAEFPFVFQALDWVELDEKDEESNDLKYTIYCSGATKSGHSVVLRILNFCPEFYVKLPDSKIERIKIINSIREKCKVNTKLTKFSVEKMEFYGYTNNKKFIFAKLVFDSLMEYNKSLSFVRNVIKAAVYNCSSYDTFLKFIHLKHLSPSGFLQVSDGENIDSVSSASINIEADFEDISRVNVSGNANLLQASFDIETYSHKGGFPDKMHPEDKIIQIGTSFKFTDSSDFCMKHIITLKDCATTELENVVVESYATEKELIMAWAKLINKTDPDVIYQFNGDTFDWDYIYNKSLLYGKRFTMAILILLNRLKVHSSATDYCDTCCNKIYAREGEVKYFACKLGGYHYTPTFSSSAYGTSKYSRLSLLGRINFDVYIYFRREFKMRFYSLNYISKTILQNEKVDLGYQEMFVLFEQGNPEDIQEIAKYCVHDTVLPQLLVDKLHILFHQICMSNVTYVPIKYLIEKGQQIKVLSQIYKLANTRGYLVPSNVQKTDEKFEGATVFEPTTGVYFQPVTVCDFSSLYPSIIRSNNLCYTTYISDYTPARYPDVPVLKVTITEDPSKHHYFAQNTDGVLPELLSELAKSREEYKGKMKNETDPFQKEIYNKMQLSYKVSMNSVYGFLGAFVLNCKPIAESVTALGRNMIKNSKEYIEEHYPKSQVVYGDSIPGNELVTVKEISTGRVRLLPINELVEPDDYTIKYPEFKPNNKEFIDTKEYSTAAAQKYLVMSSNGFVNIHKVIRHKTQKDIYRVTTQTGIVHVTEDHSLLTEKKEQIKPIDLKVNTTKLLTYSFTPKTTLVTDFPYTESSLFLYALFLVHGNITPSNDLLFSNIPFCYHEEVYKVISGFYLNHCSIQRKTEGNFIHYKVKVSEFLSKKTQLTTDFYNLSHLDEIINLPKELLEHFYNGLIKMDTEVITFALNDYTLASKIYFILRIVLKKEIQIKYLDKINIELYPYRRFITSSTENYSIVKDVELMSSSSTTDYVYDLETESGDFAAGIGNLICKNTDSVFVMFHTESIPELKKVREKLKKSNYDAKYLEEYSQIKRKCRQESIECGKNASRDVTKALFKPPVSLEFEKVFDPFVSIAKKNYFGGYYTKDTESYEKRHCSGGVAAKKGTAPILLEIYEKCMNSIIDKGEVGLIEFIDYLKEIIQEIKQNKVKEYEKFIMVGTLNENYATKTLDDKTFLITEFTNDKTRMKIRCRKDFTVDVLSGDNVKLIIQGQSFDIEKYAIDPDDKKRCIILRLKNNANLSEIKLKNEDFINAKTKTIKNCEEVSLSGTVVLPNIPHVVLARKLTKRNPLNPPKTNDKIPYVYIDLGETKMKNFEKIEDPEYAVRHNLKIDAVYYISSIRTHIGKIIEMFDPRLLDEVFN